MRKGVGISGLSRHTATTTSYASLSNTISTNQLASLQTSLDAFRDALTSFAIAHRADIRRDPAFRHQFQKMCAAIGVDPLAGSNGGGSSSSSASGWRAEMLGLGEWDNEVALQVVDVCVSTRDRNGGMIEVGELVRRIDKMRGGNSLISPEDVYRAIDLLRPLGSGYSLKPVGGSIYIRSVPRELDTDQSTLLVIAAAAGGRLREAEVKRNTGWTEVRVRTALEDCIMREGMGWIDEQAYGGRDVWLIAAVNFDETSSPAMHPD
ncbi:putative negative regulation of transcription by glucose-related protein [Kockovaella imperatae]|uniref:Putative negative regulation of transcription by glucose-related protein n=1 Tax=Kockovaella imperatae TaxID=4999 RepID=A0A1Y1UM11_9TREE|nr:putative negative regulation of transcription by glucose-related protein [Kockovaella imperatae]ORX39090.1 putative negative regulation of transcription by glucose-related protein [Kockovaella imperatae]